MMNTSELCKERRALRKAWQGLNGAKTSDVDDEALFLLAAAKVGPRKYAQIARLAGITRLHSLRLSERAREVGLFKNKQIQHSGWTDEEGGGVAFICDVLVLKGFLERTQP